MDRSSQFSTPLALASLGFICSTLIAIWFWLGALSFYSVLAGCLVGCSNIIIAFIFNKKALKGDSTQAILKPIFIGMGIRLLIIGVTTELVIKFSPLKTIEFIIALIISYFVFQYIEVRSLQNKLLLNGKAK